MPQTSSWLPWFVWRWRMASLFTAVCGFHSAFQRQSPQLALVKQAGRPASHSCFSFGCAMCLKYLSLAQIIIQLHSFWWQKLHTNTHANIHTNTHICTCVNLCSLKSMNSSRVRPHIVQIYAPQLVFSR